MRLGLCCIFKKEPIRFRTATVAVTSKQKDPSAYITHLITENIAALLQALTYCAAHDIGAFRITSTFLPLSDHPKLGYSVASLPQPLLEGLSLIRKQARSKKIRLTFHPDQFVVLNSPKPDVLVNALRTLERQAELSDHLGADVLTLHGGGVYGDKKSALQRLEEGITQLSSRMRAKLALENDDRCFTPEDLLPLCHKLTIPLVYDVHHHRCLPDTLSIEQATTQALKTWNREPLFHISSPLSKKEPRRHHDFIDPKDFPACWKTIDPLTVEVEAKAKELAVLRLMRVLLKEPEEHGSDSSTA